MLRHVTFRNSIHQSRTRRSSRLPIDPPTDAVVPCFPDPEDSADGDGDDDGRPSFWTDFVSDRSTFGASNFFSDGGDDGDDEGAGLLLLLLLLSLRSGPDSDCCFDGSGSDEVGCSLLAGALGSELAVSDPPASFGGSPCSSFASSCPTVTVSSSLANNSSIVPASGALTATSI